TLTWDNAHRLSKVSGPAGDTKYVYDADGQVLLQKDPTSTVLYLPGQQLTLTGTSVTGTRYTPLPGGGTVVRTGLGTNYRFEITDPHGTAGLSLDNTCQTPTWRQFTPYGTPRGTTVSWFDNRGFLNKPTNTTTGLTTLGVRQYDPGTGSFISPDPLFDPTDAQQLGGYNYAGSNPVAKSDPTGLRPEGKCSGTCNDGTTDLWGGGPDHWVYENVGNICGNKISITVIDFGKYGGSDSWTTDAPKKKLQPTSWGWGVKVPNRDRDFFAGLVQTLVIEPLSLGGDFLTGLAPGPSAGDRLRENYEQWILAHGVEFESANYAAGGFLPMALDDPIGATGFTKALAEDPAQAALVNAVREQMYNSYDTFKSNNRRPGMSEGLLLPDGTMYLNYSLKGTKAKNVAEVDNVLNDLPDFSRGNGHGQCGLVQCINQAIQDGRDPTGGKVAAFTILPPAKKTEAPLGPCRSCFSLVKKYDLQVLTGASVAETKTKGGGW
ncbi:RHS repeat-associated protein, partial [Kitasatospora sp. SolWspMP-SS2h]|uniref:RHS repeat domain-containing protein n=1 Tax=Kitasatospora sp. SolWspMP-SS2h TaxID=1305729 RepID=UPI000DBFA632